MTFVDSLKTCMDKSTSFKGRASRSEFWWFILGLLIFVALVWGIKHVVQLIHFNLLTFIVDIVVMIVDIVLVVALLAVSMRRLHDSNHNGWWWICPIVNIVFFLYPSDKGENNYGPEPLEVFQAEEE